MASQKTKQFTDLMAWMRAQTPRVTQADLVKRLNDVPSRSGKSRTLSEINRLLNGQIRFVDPWLGSELSYVTNGVIDALELLRFASECVALRAEQSEGAA